jgi:hypothetical protein
MLVLAYQPAPTDPGADILMDLGTRLDPSWFVLALLVPVAIVVLWFGTRLAKRDLGAGALEPKGRGPRGSSSRRDAAWAATVSRLRAAGATPIAAAAPGPVRLEATLARCWEHLGGPAGRECVWRNRAGARPESAVATDLVIAADASGRCGIENLESARVDAPTETHSVHHRSISLYIGDRVEIIGRFVPEKVGEDADASEIVYGTVGPPLDVRVLERPEHHVTPPEGETEGEPESDENGPAADENEPDDSSTPDDQRT